MGLFELLLLAVGLAMDAFAVSICKGLAVKKITAKEYLLCGIYPYRREYGEGSIFSAGGSEA